MKFSVALFDLDGVIFDTETQYYVFWGKMCRKYHPDKPGLENVIKGQTLLQIFDNYFSDFKSEQNLIIEQLNNFESNMNYLYINGIVEYLHDIRKNGVRTAVVTSSNNAKMKAVYKSRPEFRDLFDEILTAEDFEKSKPDPDCYIKGALRFGCNTSECIVFEDSFNGLKSGRSANMKVFGLSTTNPSETILPYSDYVIPDFSNLNYQKTCDILSEIK